MVSKIVTGDGSSLDALSSVTPAAIDKAIDDLLGKTVQQPLSSSTNISVATAAREGPSPGGLQKLTGALLIVQALTLGVEGTAEMTGAEALSNLAFTADLAGRTLRLVLEMIDDGEQMEDTGPHVIAETVWSLALLSTTAWKLKKDGVESEFVSKAGHLDANVSLLWGIWHLLNIDNVREEKGSCPVGLTAEAFVEVLEPFQLGAVLCEEPEAVGVLLALRVGSAMVAGAERF